MKTNHQPNIAILADDLTSAADGAAPFVARGLAMKDGGFGTDDALVRAVARLRGARGAVQPMRNDSL